MKNRYYILLLVCCSTFVCAMQNKGILQVKDGSTIYTDGNNHSMVYNPKIYMPRDAAGKPLIEYPRYHGVQAEVIIQQAITHAESSNVLIAASLKALEQHEIKAKL